MEASRQCERAAPPDYQAIRDSVRVSVRSAEALRRTADRTLGKLKMGRQSAAGKAIDAFIKELGTSKK